MANLRRPPVLPLQDVVLIIKPELAAVRLLLDDGVDRAVHVQDDAPRALPTTIRGPQLDDGVERRLADPLVPDLAEVAPPLCPGPPHGFAITARRPM